MRSWQNVSARRAITILSCPIISVTAISGRKFIHGLVRTHVVEVALGPLSTILRCNYGDIVDKLRKNQATAELYRFLVKAYPAFKLYDPRITLEQMLQWVEHRMAKILAFTIQ